MNCLTLVERISYAQAERQAQPHQIHQDAGAGARSLAVAMTDRLIPIPCCRFHFRLGWLLASCIALHCIGASCSAAAACSFSFSQLVG